jgi:hypothetical protein
MVRPVSNHVGDNQSTKGKIGVGKSKIGIIGLVGNGIIAIQVH